MCPTVTGHVKVDVKLTTVKPLHARWIIDLYHYMESSKAIILSGFKKACNTHAGDEAQSLIQVCENPFEEIEIENN